MNTKDLVQSYYESLDEKDDRWKDLYLEDAVFSDSSQTLLARGKEEIIQSFTTFLKGVAGVKLKQLIIDGENVSAIVGYDYMNSKGEKMHQDVAEMWAIKNDKLSKLTLYFDLTAYRNFMMG